MDRQLEALLAEHWFSPVSVPRRVGPGHYLFGATHAFIAVIRGVHLGATRVIPGRLPHGLTPAQFASVATGYRWPTLSRSR